MEEKEVLKEEPQQTDVKEIVSMYHSYKASKSKTLRMYNRIKSFYEGEFWEKFKEKVKEETLIPDTNYVEYCVSAFVNSIYSGVYIPEIRSKDLEDEESAQKMTSFIHAEFISKNIKELFTTWGEDCVLYNMQPVKEYYASELNKKGVKKVKTGFETISPFSIFLDPSVTDFKMGEAVFIVKETNIYSLLKDTRFKSKVKKYIAERGDKFFEATNIADQFPDVERFTTTGNKTVSIIEYFIKDQDGINNGFILNEDVLIHEKKGIIPDEFPIEILYHRKPKGGPYGTPLIWKILNSYITLNLLDSMDATQPYLAQNRPKFFDLRSRINARQFKDYGNTPGSTFPLFGEPSKSVHYEDVQFLPDTSKIKDRLEWGIFHITGVDPAYKGRQTNSITTTGGIEAQQARVIMLTDNAPIVALESFTERLAKLHLKFVKEHQKDIKARRNNFVKEMVELSLEEIDLDDYDFILESKPYIPMTKELLFQTMAKLYEMQGQYNFQIQLIQEEDLLDELPVDPIRKSKLMQRISSEKQVNAAMKRRETLLTFVTLFEQMKSAGFEDGEATDEALKIMDEEGMMQQQDPTLGMNPTGMSPQGGKPKMF